MNNKKVFTQYNRGRIFGLWLLLCVFCAQFTAQGQTITVAPSAAIPTVSVSNNTTSLGYLTTYVFVCGGNVVSSNTTGTGFTAPATPQTCTIYAVNHDNTWSAPADATAWVAPSSPICATLISRSVQVDACINECQGGTFTSTVANANTTAPYVVSYILVCGDAIISNNATGTHTIPATATSCTYYAVNHDGTATFAATGSANDLTTTGACYTVIENCVTVNPLPAFTLTPTNPTCANLSGGSILVSGLTANEAGYTVAYAGPTSGSLTAQTASATGTINITDLMGSAAAGNYSVTVTSAAGCESTAVTTTVAAPACDCVYTYNRCNGTAIGTVGVTTANTSAGYNVAFVLVCNDGIVSNVTGTIGTVDATAGTASTSFATLAATGSTCVVHAINYSGAVPTVALDPSATANDITITGSTCFTQTTACINVYAQPTLTVTNISNTCPTPTADLTTAITSSTTGLTVAYSSATPTAVGAGDYTVTVTDPTTGCTNTATVAVTINACNCTPATICAGTAFGTQTITSVNNTDGYSVAFVLVCNDAVVTIVDAGDVGAADATTGTSTGTISNLAPAAPASCSIWAINYQGTGLAASNITTSVGSSNDITVTGFVCEEKVEKCYTINAQPVVAAINNGPVCSGSPLTLTANVTTGTSSPYDYNWSGTLTDATDLAATTYTVTVSATAQTSDAIAYTVTVTDANGCTNTATTTPVVNDCTTASIGNYVWNDLDNDGQQEAGELGVGGVTVYLYADTDADGIADGLPIGTTTTDGTGFYQFTGLDAGSYLVQFVLPSGATFTPVQNGGAISSGANTSDTDSNIANTGTGFTGTITVATGEQVNTVDAGISCPTITAPVPATQTVCTGTPVNLSVSTSAVGIGAITYVYFTSAQTGAAMYSGGTLLGLVTPSGGTAPISSVSFPANTGTTAVTYYVYAILSNLNGLTTACRPFQELQVTINPATPDVLLTNYSPLCLAGTGTPSTLTLSSLIQSGPTTGTWAISANTTGATASITGGVLTPGTSAGSITLTYTLTGVGPAGTACATDVYTVIVPVSDCTTAPICAANAGDIPQVQFCQGASANSTPAGWTPNPTFGGAYGPAPTPAGEYSYQYYIANDIPAPHLIANVFPVNTLPTTADLNGLAAGTYRLYRVSWKSSGANGGTLQDGAAGTVDAGDDVEQLQTSAATDCIDLTYTYVTVRPNPVANAGLDIAICAGSTISLSGSQTNAAANPVSYAWSGVNSYASAIQNPSILNAQTTDSGPYSVTVTTAFGCSASDVVAVTVGAVPTANAGSDQAICSGVGVTIGAPGILPTTISGGQSMTIPLTVGPASPSPSNLAVSGLPTTGVTVSAVTINGVTHTYPDDIDMYLQSPSGDQVILMSDAGSGYDVSGINLTFNSTSAAIPDAPVSALTSGSYSPADYDTGDMPAGATTTLSTFTGDFNGTWALYVADGFNLDGGSIASWSITFQVPGALTYTWSPATGLSATDAPQPTATPATTTTYTVVVSDPITGCSSSDAVVVTVTPAPVATIGSNSPLCDTRDIILNSSGGGTYSWSGPNGFTSTSQNPVILSTDAAFPGVGSHVYNVTVTSGGCTATTSTTVVVNASPDISISANTPLCAGSTLTLSSTYNNPTTNDVFSWSGPAGFTSSLASPTIANVTTANTGVYTLLVANQYSCTASATQFVSVGSAPNATINANASCVAGVSSVTLSVLNAGGGATYAWSGTGVSGSTNSQTISGVAAGSQTYTVTITTATGCVSTGTTTLTVPNCVVCNIQVGAINVDNTCEGQAITATLANPPCAATPTFTVKNSAGVTVYTGASPITALPAGNYTITASITCGACTATSTNPTSFTVHSVTAPAVAQVLTDNGDTGGTTPFYYNISHVLIEGGNQPYDFDWENTGYVRYDIQYGDQDNDGIPDAYITIYYSDNANYSCTITDNVGCGPATPVSFSNVPGGGGTPANPILDIVQFMVSGQTNNNTPNGSITIYATGGDCGTGPYNYSWSGPGNYTSTGVTTAVAVIPGVTPAGQSGGSSTITGLASGWYSVTVTCAATGETTEGWYWVPRARRGRGKVDELGVGLSAMPNPFNSETNIEFYVTQDAMATVSVYSMDGKEVMQLFKDAVVADEVYSVSLGSSNLSAGVYTVVLNTDKGERTTYKVVLTK